MQNKISIDLIKKEVEKAIVNELYKKNMVDFNQYSVIMKKLDEDICELENRIEKEGNTNSSNLIVKVPI